MTTREQTYTNLPQAVRIHRLIAFNIRRLRRNRKLTTVALAADSLVPFRTIEHIEAGKVAPSFIAVTWIARALEVNVSQLLWEPPNVEEILADWSTHAKQSAREGRSGHLKRIRADQQHSSVRSLTLTPSRHEGVRELPREIPTRERSS